MKVKNQQDLIVGRKENQLFEKLFSRTKNQFYTIKRPLSNFSKKDKMLKLKGLLEKHF
jgi:hypothetical protein